jgi:protein SCO1/2
MLNPRRLAALALAGGTAAYAAYWAVRKKKKDKKKSIGCLEESNMRLILCFHCKRWVTVQQKSKADRARFKQQGEGVAQVGQSPFTLVETRHGAPVTSGELYKDQWSLVYFGYTYCPDICPAELKRMTTLMHRAQNDGDVALQPLFVSIDPQRDSVSQLRRYLAEFHPAILGLTGTPQQLTDVAQNYRIYSFRSGDAARLDDDDYLVDHSIFILLVNPRGHFVDYFGNKMSIDEIYERIRFHVNDFSKHTAKK